MESDINLLWGVLSIIASMIATIVVACIALANYLGKRIDAVNKRIDDLRTEMVRGDENLNKRMDEQRGEMVGGFENLNKRIDDQRTDFGKWVEVMEADIRELRAPIMSQASGQPVPRERNFRKQDNAAKRAGGG